MEPIAARYQVRKDLGGWGVWRTRQSGCRVERSCVHRSTNHDDAHRAAFRLADRDRFWLDVTRSLGRWTR